MSLTFVQPRCPASTGYCGSFFLAEFKAAVAQVVPVAGFTYLRPNQAFSFHFVLCYAKPYSGAWRKRGWILSDYCTLGDNPSKVSSLQTFHQLSYDIYSLLSHLFLVLSHRVCDNELLAVSFSPLLSICTAVHSVPWLNSTYLHWSRLLTDFT